MGAGLGEAIILLLEERGSLLAPGLGCSSEFLPWAAGPPVSICLHLSWGRGKPGWRRAWPLSPWWRQ